MEENNTTFVTLPEIPLLSGVRFRFFQTSKDYGPIAYLMNAVWHADQVESISTVEEIAHLYSPRPTFEPGRQLLLAERDGKIIALARHWWMKLRDGKQLYLHTHAVLPEYRGQGLEQALLHYNEHCLRVLAEQRQQAGVHRLAWADFVQDAEAATIALLEREGYQPIRYIFDMVCAELSELPSVPLPVDFHLRPIEPDHYHALYVAYKFEGYIRHEQFWFVLPNTLKILFKRFRILTGTMDHYVTLWLKSSIALLPGNRGGERFTHDPSPYESSADRSRPWFSHLCAFLLFHGITFHSWAARLTRNARSRAAGQMTIRLYGVPEHLAISLGLVTGVTASP